MWGQSSIIDSISTKDKVNLQYLSWGNPHLTRHFCEDELDLNSLLNIVSKSILVRFVGLIVSPL